jgi:uncharacterized protein YbaR (Trm112 family)
MRLTLKLCPICKCRLYFDYHQKLYFCQTCERNFELEELING